MSSNYSMERDLSELLEMCDKLREYLLGHALYMPIGGGFFRASSTPQLTTGAFLLRRRRLLLLRNDLNQAQQAQLDGALREHDILQREWRLHYEKKLQREIDSRLKMMLAFFRECAESPRECAAAYPVEAMRRTLTQEILLAMDEFAYDSSEAATKVRRTDHALRRYVQAGEFIWSPALEPLYPRETFWWLYGSPAAG